ncbi:hypothetical protein [Psychroflexus sp. MBR-150]|jgi:hypothetical protein
MIFEPILKNYKNSSDYHKFDLSTQYLEKLKVDIENYQDDYHRVCHADDLQFYKNNGINL